MKPWQPVLILLSWPVSMWQTLQARRRLRAGMLLTGGEGRLTLQRVA